VHEVGSPPLTKERINEVDMTILEILETNLAIMAGSMGSFAAHKGCMLYATFA